MEQDPPRHRRPSISRDRLVALVYVGIALIALAAMTVETYGAIQWFNAIDSLNFATSMPTIHWDNATLGYPFVTVPGSINNPTSFNGLRITYVVYTVYIGAEQNFTVVKKSSEVGSDSLTIQQSIPAGAALNLTAEVPLYSDVLVPLRTFVQNDPNPSIHVLGTVYVSSIYGTFSNVYCIEYPGNVSTTCPAGRPPPISKGGGGG